MMSAKAMAQAWKYCIFVERFNNAVRGGINLPYFQQLDKCKRLEILKEVRDINEDYYYKEDQILKVLGAAQSAGYNADAMRICVTLSKKY